MQTKTFRILLSVGLFTALFLALPEANATTVAKVRHTIASFRKNDPGVHRFFNSSYAYAVFPTVGKAGFGIGGAYGTGRVYRHGKFVGTAKLTQVSIGFQLGGQAYSEIIFFQHRESYQRFVDGRLKFGAEASAVAIKKGAAANASFHRGVAIFTATKGGLMYEASIGGQSFSFHPAK